jgi:hypothetical protein
MLFSAVQVGSSNLSWTIPDSVIGTMKEIEAEEARELPAESVIETLKFGDKVILQVVGAVLTVHLSANPNGM